MCAQTAHTESGVPTARAGEMSPEVEGTRPWGPWRKRVPECLKGPKTTYTTIRMLKNSPSEPKGVYIRYILISPGLYMLINA